MKRSNDTIFAIIGPTAVGKTRAAFELARIIGAEIISVDSRQVYRYLDVGTDKISIEERREIPHHLIDVADPDEVFTAFDFVNAAERAADRIIARGKVPILAGGSPMWYKALEGVVLSNSLPHDGSVRKDLEEFASEHGSHALHERLTSVDPISASKIHPNDFIRLSRALEIYTLTGRPASEIYAEQSKAGGSRKITYFALDSPREALYERIEKRVVQQFHSGYPEEVEWLLKNGYGRDLPAMQGFGYRELVKYIDGEMSFEDALAGDVRSTKAFARRQTTWFKQFSPVIWYDTSISTIDLIVKDMHERMSVR